MDGDAQPFLFDVDYVKHSMESGGEDRNSAYAPLGFSMGFSFPLALRHVFALSQEPAPWAWAINGSASGIASVVAIVIAIRFGFQAVLTVGACSYSVGAASCLAGLTKEHPRSSGVGNSERLKVHLSRADPMEHMRFLEVPRERVRALSVRWARGNGRPAGALA